MAVVLAVGHQLEPELLLHAHHVADRRLLNAPELSLRDLVVLSLLARPDQRVGPDQAADVIGTKGRFGSLLHFDLRAAAGVHAFGD